MGVGVGAVFDRLYHGRDTVVVEPRGRERTDRPPVVELLGRIVGYRRGAASPGHDQERSGDETEGHGPRIIRFGTMKNVRGVDRQARSVPSHGRVATSDRGMTWAALRWPDDGRPARAITGEIRYVGEGK